MTTKTWIPSVGEHISVPSPSPFMSERTVMTVKRRIRKDGKPFVQCGEYLFPLEVCSLPVWLPSPGSHVRSKLSGYQGRVIDLFTHPEQGYLMADCRMYRDGNGKPVTDTFLQKWPATVCSLEPVWGV